ncbi:penicillin-binding protein 2 [Candidatus Uhrbacteria bacterium]|nr:penicillin-binding protein 2 [Candidatus Uhrbacteria bacterium]
MGDERYFVPEYDSARMTLAHGSKHEWVESSCDNARTHDAQEFLGVSVSTKNMTLLFLCIAIGIAALFFRTAYVQLAKGNAFASLAERNKVKTVILPARRGVLYDRNGIVLVYNEPSFSLQIVPSELPKDTSEQHALFEKLSSLTTISSNDLIQKIKESEDPYQPIFVAEHIEYTPALILDAAIADLPGVSLIVRERRRYSFDSMQSLSHVVGYTGKINSKELENHANYVRMDSIGKDGIEAQYELELHGKHGKKNIEVDALGDEKEVLSEEQPKDGENMILTIDSAMQKKAEEVLSHTMKEMKKKRAVMIVSDPSDGGIRALVSLPAYDNNAFARGISQDAYKKLLDDPDTPLFHRAIRGEYPSGSTIKPALAAAGIDAGVITKGTSVLSSGGIRIGEWFFPDWKAGGHGRTTVTKAIAESVNTFFYVLGGGQGNQQGLGIGRLTAYLERFGFGARTDIDLPYERVGFIPTPEWKKEVKKEPWYIGDTYHLSIGQGDFLVTPIQMNSMTSYFANNGKSYRPHIVERIGTAPERLIQPVILREGVVSKESTAIVREGMRRTIEAGSGRRLNTLPVAVAGKTGTAQWGKGKPPHAWFIGWAPYDNPNIVLTVLIEEGEEGSRSGVSVAYEFLKWYVEEYKK